MIIVSNIGRHTNLYVLSGSDGVATVSLSAEKAQRACISKEDVKILAAIGAQVKTTFRD